MGECPHLPATCRRCVPRSRDRSRMPIREWARTHVRFHRSGASTDRAQRRQRRVNRDTSVSACAVAALLAARASAALPPERAGFCASKLIFATERRCRWDHRGFCASPRCSDRHGTLLMDRNRSCAPAAPADPDSATGRLSAWKLIQALASRMRPVMSIPTVRLSSVSARGCAIMLAPRAA